MSYCLYWVDQLDKLLESVADSQELGDKDYSDWAIEHRHSQCRQR
jgi:hypothetical protein